MRARLGKKLIGRLPKRTVTDIMIEPAVTADPELTVPELSALFAEDKINRLPIVSDQGCSISIVTRTDIAHSSLIPEKEMPLTTPSPHLTLIV